MCPGSASARGGTGADSLNRRAMEPRGIRLWFTWMGGVLSIQLVLLIGSNAILAQTSLKSRRDFVVGSHPIAAVTTDFDGDGTLDIITANQFTGNNGDLSLMKGFGDGTFRRLASITAGLIPTGVAFADATGDGLPDLIVSNLVSQEVTVHPGNGLGGFGQKISTLVSGRPSGIAVGDWNGDGKLDIATVNDSNVSTMLGDGTGRFGTLRQFPTGVGPIQIVTADFSLNTNGTNDGILDLAVVNNGSNTIQIFRGDGTGVFTLTRTLTTGVGPYSMTVGQFSTDTRLDIAVANFGDNSVGTFLANTTGGFATQVTRFTGLGPRSLATADLNKDGKLDLIVGQAKISSAGEVAVMTGDGLGGFTVQPLVHTSPKPNALITGDFNRDGNVDVAAVSLTGDTISILQNVGTPLFVDASKITLPSGAFPSGVGVADFNGDGKKDVVSPNEGLNSLSLTLGDGQCGFGPVNFSNATGATPIAIMVADFNRDGCPDLVIPTNFDNSLSYLQSNCAGGFAVNSLLPAGCLGPVAASSGDLSGDLDTDVAVVCESSNQICTRRGTGTGSFGAPVCTALPDLPGGVAIGHYDLDVLADAAITLINQGLVATCISDGSGGCVERPLATFPAGPGPQGIVRRDIDGDGYDDLVVANSGSNTISALIGDGGGIFYFPPLDSVVGLAPTAVALDDFNLDGKVDAAVVNTSANNVSLMLGDGLGHFTKAGDYGARALPVAIASGDCNGDGKPDLMVADNFDDSVTILLNQSISADPLQMVTADDASRTILRWGIVPGGTYDVIRGLVRSVVQGPSSFNLGPVTCLANDLIENDTASYADSTAPPSGNAYFYLVRSTVGGVPGQYTVSTSGKPGIPASGGCP